MMGSPDSEPGRDSDEGPQHQVTITQAFYMGECEVTQVEYANVSGINPAGYSPGGANASSVVGVDTSEFPVEYLPWISAYNYCQQLSALSDEQIAGCVYRLPTEAQWEYACRAGTTSAYNDGRTTPRRIVTLPHLGVPHPTGQAGANPWGLFDMHGNVWEFCADWYAETYDAAPTEDPLGPATGYERVFRGGWHDEGENEVGSAERRGTPPNYAWDDIGFRVTLEITPQFRSSIAEAGPPAIAGTSFDAEQAAGHQREWAEWLGAEVEVTNSINMQLALVPPGEFMMGSPESEPDHRPNEQLHPVRLTEPFYIGVHEVTQHEWQTVMGNNPSAFATSGEYADQVAGMETSLFPVESVTWFDAIEFCNALSASDALPPYYTTSNLVRGDGRLTSGEVTIAGGPGYRLPTSAEWEYACRAGTISPFHFGETSNGTQANLAGQHPFGMTEPGPFLNRTTMVGSYPANGFGLCDMHGNVWEWCFDSGGDIVDVSVVVENPMQLGDPSQRILRGGCWTAVSGFSRSAFAIGHSPADFSRDYGFRVARNASP
jgi:formylglycine-generating enzyme required for sulfatase activity